MDHFSSFQIRNKRYPIRHEDNSTLKFLTSNCTICLTHTLGHQLSLILPLTNPLPTKLVSYYLLVVLPRSGLRTRKNKTHTDSANGGPSLRPAGQCVCPWI